MKKLFVILLVSVSVILIIGGCAAAPAPAPSPAPAPAPAPAPTPAPAPAPTPAPAPAPAPAPKPAPASKPIVLSGAAMFREDDDNLRLWRDLWDAVKKQSNGELSMKFVGGPEAIASRDLGEAVRTGVVDVVLSSSGTIMSAVPEANVMNLTELTPWEEQETGWNDLANKAFQKKLNTYYLGRPLHPLGLQLFTNIRVQKPQELKGQKIRSSGLHVPFLRALGCTPVVTPAEDIYTTLQRKMVDGTVLGYPQITSDSLYEVLKYYIEPPFSAAGQFILINLDTWNRLPKPLQDVIKETHVKMLRDHVPFYEGLYEQHVAKWVKGGMQLIKFSPDDGKYFQDAFATALWKNMQATIPGLDSQWLDLLKKKALKK